MALLRQLKLFQKPYSLNGSFPTEGVHRVPASARPLFPIPCWQPCLHPPLPKRYIWDFLLVPQSSYPDKRHCCQGCVCQILWNCQSWPMSVPLLIPPLHISDHRTCPHSACSNADLFL